MIITLYNVTASKAFFTEVLIALVIGFLAGIISSRMYKISWNTNQAKVVGRIDIYGVAVDTSRKIMKILRDENIIGS